ncbi:MAG TPA: PPOX class F420-dependent oxidoreductase [Phototrophicaceae bacterium]|nr:PPOX class F420-dependent oxidoreductase [Phototrophicaceae bacterium]
MPTTIPNSHIDLLCAPVYGILTTVMPDGQPQCSLVWIDYDGCNLLLNTTLERQKVKNMRSDPKVTLLVIDPQDSSRWLEVRGRVIDMEICGAEAHADQLTRRYTGKSSFYGDIYPVEQKQKETRVIVRIEPIHIALDAFFREPSHAAAHEL